MILGLAVGLVWARRRRWSDQALALYLDARLGSAEAVTTALEGGDTGTRKNVERQAAETLARQARESSGPAGTGLGTRSCPPAAPQPCGCA